MEKTVQSHRDLRFPVPCNLFPVTCSLIEAICHLHRRHYPACSILEESWCERTNALPRR
jgi:hypothetical protein